MNATMERMKRCWLGAGMAAALIAAGCAQKTPPAGQMPATAAPRDAAPGPELCLGRYALRVPARARVVGRDQSMARLGLRVRDLPPGTTRDDLPNHAPWLTAADLNTRTGLTTTQLAPDTLLLTWRATNRDAAIVDTEVVRMLPGVLIAAHGRGEGTTNLAAQRDTALALVQAAVPRPEAEVPAGGFCIDRAVINRGFAGEEFAGAVLDIGRDQRLFATTRSNGGEVGPRLSDGGPGTAPPDVSVLRAGPRNAGGQAGDELVLSRPRSRNQDMLLMWRFVGMPNSGAEPALELRLEASDVAAPEAVIAEWDAILASLRRRGD